MQGLQWNRALQVLRRVGKGELPRVRQTERQILQLVSRIGCLSVMSREGGEIGTAEYVASQVEPILGFRDALLDGIQMRVKVENV